MYTIPCHSLSLHAFRYKEKYFVRGQITRADRPENLDDGRALSHTWVFLLLVAIS